EHLLIHIAREMERLYRNIRSLERALQQRPEVLHAVCVNATAHISLSLVNEVMHESALQTITIGNGVVGVDRAPKLHIAKNFVLQGFAGYIWYDLSANLAKIAVKYSMHNGLVLERAKPISLQATALVHVLSDTADKTMKQIIRFAVAAVCLCLMS